MLNGLLRANLAASAAILLVFALRPIARRVLGARAVYRLWLIVPVAALACFIPAQGPAPRVPDGVSVVSSAPEGEMEALSATTRSAMNAASSWIATVSTTATPSADNAALLLAIWYVVAIMLLARAVIRSHQLIADPTLGPALVGMFRPRLVLPKDFKTRFDEREQTLVLAHEAVHEASAHPLVNGVIEICRCVSWMNPLVHIAAFHARADQEIACDAAVVEQFPSERRAYAEALLKTQIARVYPPLGCAWPGRSPSLLRRRIEMLGRRLPSRTRTAAGVVVVTALMAGTGYAAWSAQVAQNIPAAAAPIAQNPPVAPPTGLLTRLEAGRHTLYVQRARSGNIDIVFIGDSTTDFWRYPPERDQWNRTGGKPEWDRRYAPVKAVNFGVEGAHTRSVLWRLQNGELEGYRAKVFVLTPLGIADIANHHLTIDDAIAGNAAIVAEIRKRQPQAKILINSIPRGMHPADRDNTTQTIAAGAAKLADDRVVYFHDISSRFIRADGGLDDELTGLNGGTLTLKGYVVWGEAMEARLRELLR